jgi:XTP/dITP diphosphohydrolase
MNIWFASGNEHKRAELQAILGVNLHIPSEIGIHFDPEETGASFCENALLKARELRKILDCKDDIIIADDSGLCVDALEGRPGIFSARYGGKNLSSTQRNALLLDEMENNPFRSARFVCAMVLLFDENRFCIAQETVEGEIITQMRGEGGFGYDPVFLIPRLGRTLAEISDNEKNTLSHRGKAGKIIRCFLCKN